MSVGTLRRAAGTPSRLCPKEHGAYAILGMPLLTAVVIGGLSVVGALTILASTAGFLANEPLMVVLGRRGQRARAATPAAWSWLVAWLVLALVSGTAAFFLASDLVRIALATCGVLAGAGFAMSLAGWQRTLTAQLMAVFGLTMPSAVVLLAGGVEWQLSVSLCSAWILGLISTTAAVRGLVARSKTSRTRHVVRLYDGLLLMLTIACLVGVAAGVREWITISPLLLAAMAIRAWPPPMQQIRRVGWHLVAVNAVSGLWMMAWASSWL